MTEQIQIDGLSDEEIDELSRTAPDGVVVHKRGLAMFAPNSPDIVFAVIEIGGGVASGLIANWLSSRLFKYGNRPEKPRTLRIKKEQFDLTDANTLRALLSSHLKRQP